ncbi:MAG: hypothetical protein ACKN9F_09750 [Methylomonas sp.]
MTLNIVVRLDETPKPLKLSASILRQLIKEGKVTTVKRSNRGTGIWQSQIAPDLAKMNRQ